MNESLDIGLWNVEWASRASTRGNFFCHRLAALSNHVLCVTEGHADLFPATGHTITATADYGYPLTPGRRKVLLWSSKPWADVDEVGSPLMPSGRFIAGTTVTPFGPTRFIGVCIPWHDAHVRTGKRNRQTWEDHLTFLHELGLLLRQRDNSLPTILLGDFNQRVPRARQPEHVYTALMSTLGADFQLVTAGNIINAPDQSIDHVAVTNHIQPVGIEFVSHHDSNGVRMSDHFGLRIFLKSMMALNKSQERTE